jgi:hypothetical protein
MGVFARVRAIRYPGNLTVALVLVLALAGSAAPSAHNAAAARPDAGPASAPTAASVTVISPQHFPSGPHELPAIHIEATGVARSATQLDVANILLKAYRSAAASAPASCHLQPSLLAAIGEVETGSLAGRPLDAQHRTSIFGPVLDGHHGFRAIPDTDNGRWDGNRTWDRAMGPLQFIPSTWRTFGVDGDGDGVADPQDVEDSTATAAAYLCYGGRDLSKPATLRSAILAYNASSAYQQLVLTYQKRFASFGLDRRDAVVGLSLGAAGAPVPGRALAGVFTGPSPTSTNRASGRHGHPARHHQKTATARTTDRVSADGPPATSGATKGPGASSGPTGAPSKQPTKHPTKTPSGDPTGSPGDPSGTPTDDPTACVPPAPSDSPSSDPVVQPSAGATDDSTGDDTGEGATCPPCGTTGEPGDAPPATATPSPSPDPSATDPGDPATCQPPVTEPSSSAAP